MVYELSALRSPFNAFNLNGLVSKICKSAVAPLPSQYTEDWNSVIKWWVAAAALLMQEAGNGLGICSHFPSIATPFCLEKQPVSALARHWLA